MSNWVTYKNGNYNVSLDLETGTKVRENDLDSLVPEFPENCDLKITDFCDAGCLFCFLPGTRVATNNGYSKIENLKVGDNAVSFDEETGSNELNKVVRLYQREYEGEVINIQFEDFSIFCTPNHKFLTSNRGWIESRHLTEEDEIVSL